MSSATESSRAPTTPGEAVSSRPARSLTRVSVLDAVRGTAWADVVSAAGTDKREVTLENLHGRRKMTALIRRTTIPTASRGAIDRVGGNPQDRVPRRALQDHCGRRIRDRQLGRLVPQT